jgi:hypothetical protein
MALPHRLADNLRRVLGDQAGEDMVSWMDGVDSHRSDSAQLRVDFAEFRELMHADFAELRQDFATLRQEMRDGDAKLREEMKEAKYDLIKWSFVFWVSAIMSVAALAGILRQ